MNTGRTIFSQIMDYVPVHEFHRCVERYHGSYKVLQFSCWDHFLCIAFAQLTYRESPRDIIHCLGAHKSRWQVELFFNLRKYLSISRHFLIFHPLFNNIKLITN